MPLLKKLTVFNRGRSKDRKSKTQPEETSPITIKSCNSNFQTELCPLGILVRNYHSKSSKNAIGTTKSLPTEKSEQKSVIHLPRPVSVPRNLDSQKRNSSDLFSDGHLVAPSMVCSEEGKRKARPRSYHEKDTIEQDLTCAICLEVLHRPRELTCGHAFCLLCLQNYSNSCSSKFCCPSCRQMVILPLNGVSDLRRNARLEHLSEQLSKKQSQMTSNARLCIKCQSEEEVTECHHCGKGWCKYCNPAHAEEVKKEFLSLRMRLEEAKEMLRCRKQEDETRYQRLEKKIEDVIEFKVTELLERKEKLSKEISDLRSVSAKQHFEHSQDLNSVLGNSCCDSSQNILWGEEIPKLRQLLKSSTANTPRITFDCSSLILNSTSSEGRPTEDESSEDRSLTVPMEQGSLYRKKSSYSKHKWGHHICERPAGVAISPWNNFIYVTGSDACKVYIYDQGGKQVGNFGSRGHEDGQLLCPIGIAFSHVINELYITDKWKHCIHVFDCEGKFLRQLGKKGKGLGQFSSPEGIATDSNGNIYIADTCNDRVQVLDSEGVFLKEVGVVSSEVVGHGRRYTKREFSEPVGVAVNPNGTRIYVADSGNHRIRVFDSASGDRILMFGSRGRNKGQFESPEGIAIDSQGFIIVGDSGNGRVQVFRPNGQFVRFLGAKSRRKGEFGWVSGVTITNSNDVIVTDFKNNSLAVF